MKLIKLTAAEIKANSAREYNPRIWDETIERYMKYTNVQFYIARKDHVYEYDRFFAVYTIKEGLRLLNSVGYGGSLTSCGFTRVFIAEDGEVIYRGFGEDQKGRVVNNKEGRKWLVENLCKYEVIVTNG